MIICRIKRNLIDRKVTWINIGSEDDYFKHEKILLSCDNLTINKCSELAIPLAKCDNCKKYGSLWTFL